MKRLASSVLAAALYASLSLAASLTQYVTPGTNISGSFSALSAYSSIADGNIDTAFVAQSESIGEEL